MNLWRISNTRKAMLTAGSALTLAVCTLMSGCGQAATSGPLSFKGVVSGSVSDTRSTRESLDTADGSSAQTLPLNIDPGAALTFEDLEGNPLLDANGDAYPPADVDANGLFTAGNLPVGVDFVVAVDLDGDGVADVLHIVHIPADATGTAGAVNNLQIDPLTTLIVAAVRDLLSERGINPDDIGISPTAIAERVIDAFIHFFEETGIEQVISLDDIANLSPETVEELLNTILPAAVRTGLETAGGSLDLTRAADVQATVHAAAEVFLRAGFPIADGLGGFDLSFLGALPDVEIKSIYDVFVMDDAVIQAAQLDITQLDLTFDPALLDGLDLALIESILADGVLDAQELEALLADGTLDPALLDSVDPSILDSLDAALVDTIIGPTNTAFVAPTIYMSTVSEPDRNFVNDAGGPDGDGLHLPIINEWLLERMAGFHLEGRTISLRNLYRLLTDAEVGLGVRLTYWTHSPDGFPTLVFESADGSGVSVNLDQIMFDLFDAGVTGADADMDKLEAEETLIRDKLREILAGTSPPSVQRLFGAILSDRIENAEQLFSFIRKTQAHLPFSRSGPSTFYVIADGDPFKGASVVNAVSVDVQFGAGGAPTLVTYNSNHTGKYYLGFSFDTEQSNRVELIVRETGRFLHDSHGNPMLLDMGYLNLFEPVNGVPFVNFVSESGAFWPGVPVTVENPEYRIDGTSDHGATTELFVLAETPGFDANPVRVSYDLATATFSLDPHGRYYMMFAGETDSQGLFGLYDTELNFMVGVNDLSASVFVDQTTTVDPTITPDGSAVAKRVPGIDDPLAAQAITTTTIQTIEPWQPLLIAPSQVVGLTVQKEVYNFVYGTEVPNENFDSTGNPYFDDVNGNGIEDAGEFTADFRPMLWNPDDWRSTDISRYYRRADTGAAVIMAEVDFGASTPQTLEGVALVARIFLPRLNAFRFGRPNSAINLLTTFLPPEFFNGTHALTEDTQVGVFQALSMINLVMEQVFNVEATIDFDGPGPFPPQTILIDATLFVIPVGDPFVLLLDGFDTLSVR